MIILHDLVYAPLYAPVRAAAKTESPQINLLRQYVVTARYARWLARQHTNRPVIMDQQAVWDWQEAARFYPNLLLLPPSFLISNGLRRVKEELVKLVGGIIRFDDAP